MNKTGKVVFYGLFVVFLCKVTEARIVVLENEKRLEEFHDTELPFSHSEVDLIEGVILSADPPDACSPIVGPPDLKSPLNWFVLVAGNFCDYGTKVIYAELAGYSAAVIYSLKGKDIGSHRARHHHAYYSNISAVMIKTRDGLIIKDNYLYTIDKRFGILLTPNHSSSNWISSLQKYRLLFVTVAFFIIIFAIPVAILKYVQRSHEIGNSRLSTRHLEQLPTSRFRTGDPYETCAICLEDFKSNDKLRILPCCHGYHASCIDQWLTENRRICPICKKRVIFNGELSEANDNSERGGRSETTPLLRETEQRLSSGGSYRALSNNPYQGRLHFVPYSVRQVTDVNVPSDNAGSHEASARNRSENAGTSGISNYPDVHTSSRTATFTSN